MSHKIYTKNFFKHFCIQLLYKTAVGPRGFDYIFNVKNRIGPNGESMSLGDLLESITIDDFNLEKIHFGLKYFDVKQNGILNKVELKKLAMHFTSEDSHGSAVGLLNNPQSKVGHAVSMYAFCKEGQKEYFCYKDSSAQAYPFFNSETDVPMNDEGLKIYLNEHNCIDKAWTFCADTKS